MSIYDEPPPFVSRRARRTQNAVSTVFVVTVAVVAIFASAFVAKAVVEAALGQCTPSWVSGTDPQLCLNAQISRRTLFVSGSASLPDGAIIQVSAEDFGTGANQHWVTDTVAVTVANGSFGRSFDLSTWGAGTVTVTALFEVGPGQPAELFDRYGAYGERLSGPEVVLDLNAGVPAPRAVQVSTNVDLSAG